MSEPTPETVTLENVYEYIKSNHGKGEHPIEYYNTEARCAVLPYIYHEPKADNPFFKRWIKPLYINEDDENDPAEIWIFGADKAGLDKKTTVADFCEFFDIDLTATLLSHIATTNDVMQRFSHDIMYTTDKHVTLHNLQCDIQDIANNYFKGGFIVPNRKGTLVFSLASANSLLQGYFHYFNVIGRPDEVKRAYYFMLKHMNYTESCWGGPW